MASKIQSHVRGYLFRNKRDKALKRLMQAGNKQNDDLDFILDGEEFNAEEFLDVKQENLHAYPNLLMD